MHKPGDRRVFHISSVSTLICQIIGCVVLATLLTRGAMLVARLF